MIYLGSTVRDAITGFTGIVTARTEYLYGSPTLRVQPTVLTTSNCHPDYVDFDESQCCIVPEQDLAAEMKKVVL